jgi:hypothetical protein
MGTDTITITPCRGGFRAILRDNGRPVAECIRQSPTAALESVLELVDEGPFAGNPIQRVESP